MVSFTIHLKSNFTNQITEKGVNIWDYITHANPSFIVDKSNGDVACDSYHQYLEDVRMLKTLGVDFYRFSLSWTRISPNGLNNIVNPQGIDYYNKLINALLAEGIEPVVTLFHWDLPQYLQLVGGWANPILIQLFSTYAKIAFENFGDRVKIWTTFNEPYSICNYGYGSKTLAPALSSSGLAEYQCAHNLLKAHAKVYHMYNDNFRHIQKGAIKQNV